MSQAIHLELEVPDDLARLRLPAGVQQRLTELIKRAANCCEYCGLAQTGQEATFHVDHVVPVVAGGQSTSENLALACVSCSLRKGARLVTVDPHTGEEIVLFDPRRDAWLCQLPIRVQTQDRWMPKHG